MSAYILRRLLQAIPVLFVVSIVVFFSMQRLPGDPARHVFGDEGGQEQLDALRAEMGLDKPVVVQYVNVARQCHAW